MPDDERHESKQIQFFLYWNKYWFYNKTVVLTALSYLFNSGKHNGTSSIKVPESSHYWERSESDKLKHAINLETYFQHFKAFWMCQCKVIPCN